MPSAGVTGKGMKLSFPSNNGTSTAVTDAATLLLLEEQCKAQEKGMKEVTRSDQKTIRKHQVWNGKHLAGGEGLTSEGDSIAQRYHNGVSCWGSECAGTQTPDVEISRETVSEMVSAQCCLRFKEKDTMLAKDAQSQATSEHPTTERMEVQADGPGLELKSKILSEKHKSCMLGQLKEEHSLDQDMHCSTDGLESHDSTLSGIQGQAVAENSFTSTREVHTFNNAGTDGVIEYKSDNEPLKTNDTQIAEANKNDIGGSTNDILVPHDNERTISRTDTDMLDSTVADKPLMDMTEPNGMTHHLEQPMIALEQPAAILPDEGTEVRVPEW